MSFNPLPAPAGAAGHAFSATNPTVVAYRGSKGEKNDLVVAIPRELLRRARLNDTPGARASLLIGSDDDAGKLLIRAGDTERMNAPGKSKRAPCRLYIRTGRAADGPHPAATCSYTIRPGEIEIELPHLFPIRRELLGTGADRLRGRLRSAA